MIISNITDSFASGVKTLDTLSDIASNPGSSVNDLIDHLGSNLVKSNLSDIYNSLGNVAHTPSVNNLSSSLTDVINSILKPGSSLSSFIGSNTITDPTGVSYDITSTLGHITGNDITGVITAVINDLHLSGILSDSKVSNINSDIIGFSLDKLSKGLDNLVGSDYVGYVVKNSILDQLGATLNNLKAIQAAPEAETFQTQQAPDLKLTRSDAGLNDIQSAAYFDPAFDGEKRDNPMDPLAIPGKARPDNRPNIPIGVEPTKTYKGRYPFNKSYRSESGHIIEVDDTPGEERLLDQHSSGTYQEMHPNGDHVIKVVGSNYTAVAESNKISIEGDAHVYVHGSCRLHIGEMITIMADGGFNLVSKGDFRVKAKSINLESTGGDVNIKSSHNTLFTTKNEHHVSTKTHIMESSIDTSIKAAGSVAIEGAGVGVDSKGPITAIAKSDLSLGGATIYATSDGEIDIRGGAVVNIDGSITNVQTGIAKLNPNKPEKTKSAKTSYGSGINYVPDPKDELLANDDDPEALAAAIKRGLENGTLTKEDVEVPSSAIESDTDMTDNGAPKGTNKSTIGNIGPTPSDNLALSPHYKLYDLTKGCHFPHAICAQHGLTVSQIAGNLQLVAVNILEKLRLVYPDVFVTSGFRPGNGKSQHERGQAVDLQFHNGSTPERCIKIAQWIKANLDFDQLILEYSNRSRCWIHCSYNSNGNRPWGNSTKVMTMIGGKYTPGLYQY